MYVRTFAAGEVAIWNLAGWHMKQSFLSFPVLASWKNSKVFQKAKTSKIHQKTYQNQNHLPAAPPNPRCRPPPRPRPPRPRPRPSRSRPPRQPFWPRDTGVGRLRASTHAAELLLVQNGANGATPTPRASWRRGVVASCFFSLRAKVVPLATLPSCDKEMSICWVSC